MRLAFEDVSYSYEGGEAKKRRGRRKKDAARQASDLLDVPRNAAYARALELKEQLKNQSGSDTLE